MATITTGYTFVNNETVTPVKLNSLAGGATISGIVNAEIDASAGIVDTKLATIATANKVANSATTATNANTVNAIVARDASGNFSAGTITANLTGNVTGNATGLSAPASKGLATAWINFNGTGTWTNGVPTSANTRSSHNVSSVTRNAIGDFTITWAAGVFTTGNYAVFATGQDPTGASFTYIYPGAAATYLTPSSVRVRFADSTGTLGSPNTGCVVAFGT